MGKLIEKKERKKERKERKKERKKERENWKYRKEYHIIKGRKTWAN